MLFICITAVCYRRPSGSGKTSLLSVLGGRKPKYALALCTVRLRDNYACEAVNAAAVLVFERV